MKKMSQFCQVFSFVEVSQKKFREFIRRLLYIFILYKISYEMVVEF